MTYQGKLLMKHKVPWFMICLELTLALPWSIEINDSKISFYCNIFLSQYCASKCLVWIRPKAHICRFNFLDTLHFRFRIGKFLIKTQGIALHFYLGLKNESLFGRAAVNFINFICARFCTNVVLAAFSGYMYVVKQRSYEKFVCKNVDEIDTWFWKRLHFPQV